MENQFNKEAGFTLIEMILVILIVAILVALGGQLIVAPVTGYSDLARRSKLVDQADQALRCLQNDLRQALPNSLRVAGEGKFLELLHSTDKGRYRSSPDPNPGGDDILDFTGPDDSFEVLGRLRETPSTGHFLVIDDFAASGASGSPYHVDAQGRARIAAGSSPGLIKLSSAYQFSRTSPRQRFYIVDEPVTYACEGGELKRYSGYDMRENQQTSGLGRGSLVTRGITDCRFDYTTRSGAQAGLVTMELTLSQGGEAVRLFQQIPILNTP